MKYDNIMTDGSKILFIDYGSICKKCELYNNLPNMPMYIDKGEKKICSHSRFRDIDEQFPGGCNQLIVLLVQRLFEIIFEFDSNLKINEIKDTSKRFDTFNKYIRFVVQTMRE